MGPFVATGSNRNPPQAEDESARIALDTGFLSLGFDRAAAAGHRVAQIGRKTKPEGSFSVGDKPFSKAQIAEGQKFATLYHITPEEERAMAGISAALEGFFGLAAQTPALNKILFKIFNVPSPLSLLSKGHLPNVGIMTGLYDATPGDPKNWHLTADAPLYDLPSAVMVNQDPGLYLDTMVTTPYPPFLVTGGVWFCYGKGFDEPGRLRHFDQGLELLEAIHCPLIVGDIPDVSAAANGILSTDELPSSKTLATANRRLKEWAAKHRAVVVVPLAKFIKTAMADQVLAVHDSILPVGKTRALIQNDKLHPTARGCAVLALAILDAFQANQSGVGERDVRWNVETVLDTALESSQRVGNRNPRAVMSTTEPESK